ncbi:MAG: hypothetical protein HYZ50_25560 [Deltaproteobacteria bacterium]|nr:hypothetical protein [Deltaproteobacteria bacterium]
MRVFRPWLLVALLASTVGTSCTDDGNVCSTDRCNGSSKDCQHPTGNAGMVCRASTGACDVAETCTGASLSCPADTGAPDSDNDGQCDAIDFCTNGAAITGSKIGLSNFANGDDAVNFSGTLAFATLPAFDPIANGVRVVLADADGALFDVTIPGGAYNSITKTGWKLNKAGTQWKFNSPTAVGGAINQVILTKRAPQMKFTIKGIKGSFSLLFPSSCPSPPRGEGTAKPAFAVKLTRTGMPRPYMGGSASRPYPHVCLIGGACLQSGDVPLHENKGGRYENRNDPAIDQFWRQA